MESVNKNLIFWNLIIISMRQNNEQWNMIYEIVTNDFTYALRVTQFVIHIYTNRIENSLTTQMSL